MKKRIICTVFGLIIMLVSAVSFSPAQVSAQQDCDDNAIMRCGAQTRSELSQKTIGDVTNIYGHYGIQKSHFSSLVEGTVYKDGRIVVGNKTVATNAISTGRQNMPGSRAVTAGGVGIYERPTSVSFNSASLPAFVRMVNGRFQYAIIKSCGNPTKGTPTAESQPPKISISKTVSKAVVNINEEFTYTVRVRNTGAVDIPNAHVYDKAPAGVEFIPNSSTAGTTISKTEFKTTIALLKKNEVKQFSFKAKFPNYVANAAINEACVLAEKPQPVGDCDKASNRPQKPPVKPEECLPGIPVGDERCEPTPEVPIPEEPAALTPVVYTKETKELPSTGPGEVVGAAMGLSSTAYGTVSYIRSRRGLKALFKK